MNGLFSRYLSKPSVNDFCLIGSSIPVLLELGYYAANPKLIRDALKFQIGYSFSGLVGCEIEPE